MTSLVPFPVWTRTDWANQEVAGEYYREGSWRRLLPRDLPRDGYEQQEVALLVREPHNRHDRNAIRVEIRGEHVGYLPSDDARRYRRILDHLADGGYAAQVHAHIWARPEIEYTFDRRGETKEVNNGNVSCRITLALPEPHLLIPRNPPPIEPHALLPMGGSLIVKSDGVPMSVFESSLATEGEAWVHVTLHEAIDQLARSTRERVDVHLNDRVAGYLTPATSQKFLPIIRTLAQQGRLCASPAALRGNRLQIDLRVCGQKAAELSSDWLLENANHAVVSRDLSSALPASPVRAPQAEAPVPTTPQYGVPGWFPDPQEIAPLRYWDGTAWTSRIRTRIS